MGVFAFVSLSLCVCLFIQSLSLSFSLSLLFSVDIHGQVFVGDVLHSAAEVVHRVFSRPSMRSDWFMWRLFVARIFKEMREAVCFFLLFLLLLALVRDGW